MANLYKPRNLQPAFQYGKFAVNLVFARKPGYLTLRTLIVFITSTAGRKWSESGKSELDQE